MRPRKKGPTTILRQDRLNKEILEEIIRENPDLFRGGNMQLLGEAEVAGTYDEVNDRRRRLREEFIEDLPALGKEIGFEIARMVPFLGEAIDLVELGKVNLEGVDLYGDETNKALYNTFAAAGLVIPNVLERPLKLLLRKGARNADDVIRVIRTESDSPDLAPLRELEQKSQEFQSRMREAMPRVGDLQAPYAPYIQGARAEVGAANYLLENDPDLLMKFTPEAYDQGMYDAAMRDFADQYLTSYRGVNAPDPETAARYMTEVQKGGNIGGQMEGPGIYMGNEGVTGGYGRYTGTVRTSPEIGQGGQSADDIARQIGILEAYGAADINLPIEERQILSDIGARQGFKTYNDRARVVRSAVAPGQQVIDVVPTTDFVPGVHRSDYYGAARSTPTTQAQRGTESAIINLLPEILRTYNKGGRIRAVKR